MMLSTISCISLLAICLSIFSVYSNSLSQMFVGFCPMPFLCRLRWSCVSPFVLLMWRVTLIDLHVLSCPFILRTKAYCMLYSPLLNTFLFYFFKFYLLIFIERKEGRGRERETGRNINVHLLFYWLILVCALTGDRPCNLVYWDYVCSNPLSYLARAL